jgi:hypothetical protein
MAGYRVNFTYTCLLVPAILGGLGGLVKTVTGHKTGRLTVQISVGLRYFSLLQNAHADTEIHISSSKITVWGGGGWGGVGLH